MIRLRTLDLSFNLIETVDPNLLIELGGNELRTLNLNGNPVHIILEERIVDEQSAAAPHCSSTDDAVATSIDPGSLAADTAATTTTATTTPPTPPEGDEPNLSIEQCNDVPEVTSNDSIPTAVPPPPQETEHNATADTATDTIDATSLNGSSAFPTSPSNPSVDEQALEPPHDEPALEATATNTTHSKSSPASLPALPEASVQIVEVQRRGSTGSASSPIRLPKDAISYNLSVSRPEQLTLPSLIVDRLYLGYRLGCCEWMAWSLAVSLYHCFLRVRRVVGLQMPNVGTQSSLDAKCRYHVGCDGCRWH